MHVSFAYHGRSGLSTDGLRGGASLNLMPNLTREAVAFDAAIRQPLRFREAICALHDVVISDLRFKKRDKSAYEAWKVQEQQRLRQLQNEVRREGLAEVALKRKIAVPKDFEREYNNARKRYWSVRDQYSDYLRKNDPAVWRQLVPCDPVITVADDVVFFECFSADESSYGCLTVRRDAAFGSAGGVKPGTTNVDYSWELYHHFNDLRTYRETRFKLDPAGFELARGGGGDTYREEKIDLPSGWLRGFMQIQAAMALPLRKVTLSREVCYSLLAHLKRHKASTSPRALRFDLIHGAPPMLVLEPWELRMVSFGQTWQGPDLEPIRIWGRQRLLALARALPLAQRVDVYLLGTGLPSFWVVDMGDMQLTLGLSGWTTNDWTRASALDLLSPPVDPPAAIVEDISAYMMKHRAATFAGIDAATARNAPVTAAALNRLARTGQLIADLPGGVYRWRQIMPRVLGEADVGPENAELAACREILRQKKAIVTGREPGLQGGLIITGKAESTPCDMVLDSDGRIKRAHCLCSHHRMAGIRMGPCRHLLAVRQLVWNERDAALANSAADWYARFQ